MTVAEKQKEWDGLSKPQQRLLRSLGKVQFGIELGGRWVGTGRALCNRDLAKGSRSFVSLTERGKDLLAAVESGEVG